MPIVFDDVGADGNALVADVCAEIALWACDELADVVLRLPAERTLKGGGRRVGFPAHRQT